MVGKNHRKQGRTSHLVAREPANPLGFHHFVYMKRLGKARFGMEL